MKVIATSIAAFALLPIPLNQVGLADMARMIAVPLLLYGVVDTSDGLPGPTSKVDRLAEFVCIGPAAKAGAIGGLVPGTVFIFIGLVAFSSAEPGQHLSN